MGRSFSVGQYTYYRHDYHLEDRHSYSRWSPGETKTVTIPPMVSGYEYIEGESSIKVVAGKSTSSSTVYFSYGEESSKGGRKFSFEYVPPSTIKITSLLEVTIISPTIRLECTGYSTSEVSASIEGVYMEHTSLDDMPATVSDGTRTYSVTSAGACYKNCAIQNAPALSSNLLEMNECFYNCSQLVTAPTIPSGVENMDDCFSGCSSLTQAPEIPSGVRYILNCFKNCVSLQGNIVVHTNVFMSDSGFPVFTGTVNDIFIIDKGTEAATWKKIASYLSNVHYEADDAIAPVITNFKAIRVDASGDTTPEPTGLYAYVTAKLSIDKTNIPVGWANEVKAKILTDNGSTESPTWYSQSGTDPLQVWCWVSLGDTSTHELSLQITDSIKEGSTEKKSQQSQEVYASILKSYALVDYYHDENASGVTEGMAIGKYAEHANLLDIDMPTKHRQDIECPDMTAQEVQDFIDSLNVGGGGTAVDLVVEQGTSGIWTYRKWSSGIAECWGKKTAPNITTTAWSGWYYVLIDGENYPSGLFTSVTSAMAQLASGYDFVSSARNQTHGGGALSTTTSPDVLGVRPSAGTTYSPTAYWHTIGTWK